MKKNFSPLFAIIMMSILITACGDESIESKKIALKEKEKELRTLTNEINELKKTIGADTTKSVHLATLVKTTKPKLQEFEQKIEIPGTADSKQNIIVSSEANGMVTNIYLLEGSMVKKGQVIARVEAESIAQQVAELKTRLEFATQVYEKQERLWKQKIGSEIEFLQAKSNKESLEKSINSLKVQASKATITAPISGYLDEVFLKEGQMINMGSPAARIVNLNKIIIQTDVSEKYVNAIKAGDTAEVYFESIDKNYKLPIKTVGQVVNADNRTFIVEIEIDNKDHLIKPNVLAKVKLVTYRNKNALTIPTFIIQQAKSDEFVYVAKKGANGYVATKKIITKGKSFSGVTEITSGLKSNDIVITIGGRGLSEEEPIRLQ